MSNVYYSTASAARERGELDLYRAETAAREATAIALAEAVRDNYDGYYLHTAEIVAAAAAVGGLERVKLLLAAAVLDVPAYDVRITGASRAWAASIEGTESCIGGDGHPRGYVYTVYDIHHCLLDGIVEYVRSND